MARTRPHDLVPTAGTFVDRIVGRQELSQVIAQTLRSRRTRRPYLLVGGVGAGKTAVLVELTRMLARQSAVPVPIRLRDADGTGDGELDFEKMAQLRFAQEADQGVLARGQIDKTWRQLRLDDKAVVIADGLEEALLDKRHRDDRDNIIRRAIERADRQKLPLVIASRPHAPLEGTSAAIADLEPLSEEAALEYLAKDATEADERRLDWIVETAEVTESPIYLQITRVLSQHGLLEHVAPREGAGYLNTRSQDRTTLRLWLLDTYREAIEHGVLFEDTVMGRRERQETLWVTSALACLGLLQDSLEVRLADLLDAHAQDLRDARSSGAQTGTGPPPDRASGATGSGAQRAEQAEPSTQDADEPGRTRLAASREQRDGIWRALHAVFSPPEGGQPPSWLNPLDHPSQSRSEFARYVANAQLLGLVRAYQDRVRFPHSIIQAYLGYRLLSAMDDAEVIRLVKPALRTPGPARELLIALLLLSRHWALTQSPPPPATGREAATAGADGGDGPPVAGDPPGTRRGLVVALREAAAQRQDAKFLDLHGAALDINSVDPDPAPHLSADALVSTWPLLNIRGDERTVEEAKLSLVRRFGAALREADRRSGAQAASGQVPSARFLPYKSLFEIAAREPSHPVRVAIAHQIAAGGDAAFGSLREYFPLGADPVRQYQREMRDAKSELDAKYCAWLARSGAPHRADPHAAEARRQEHQRMVAEYADRRDVCWRRFAMRAWLVPMLPGSVSATYRDEAKERLAVWLRHMEPAGRGRRGAAPSAGRGRPDLPLSLENALAQGFKNAANRRKLHPGSRHETRAYLVKQAEKMLVCSRYWYAQVSLLQALCLWELPDSVGGGSAHNHRPKHSAADPAADGAHAADGMTDPVRIVSRWLSMAGSAHEAPSGAIARPQRAGRLLHPFVAEAGDLVTLALETGHPEQFLWIDESGAIDNVGSTPTAPDQYRKHSLWVPPSVGWSILHPRAQRLVADMLLMINLTERDGNPDEIEERLSRAGGPTLPPCITSDRGPLHPERGVGRADSDEPGATCLPTCRFRLCPYPPKAGKARAEIEEPFCRQQQALLHSRVRWRLPAVSRHTAPWVSIPVSELHAFWERMSNRNRKSTTDDPRVF